MAPVSSVERSSGMKAEEIAALTVETRNGSMYFLPDDDPIGKSLTEYGEWAQGEIDFLSAVIGRSSSVVDVGAYLGTHTLAFARRVGSRGSVRAFEPQPAIFALLERTLDRNDCSNVIATCVGLAGSAGEMIVPTIDYNSHVNAGAVALMRPGTGADD